MVLSGVYTVCLTFSLLWETQIVHTKLENNIEEIKSFLTIFPINAMDIKNHTKYTNDCVINFLLLSAT